jgi:hypothetical protein
LIINHGSSHCIFPTLKPTNVYDKLLRILVENVSILKPIKIRNSR